MPQQRKDGSLLIKIALLLELSTLDTLICDWLCHAKFRITLMFIPSPHLMRKKGLLNIVQIFELSVGLELTV